ncbi:MAG TPA: hypothetical protein PLC22_11195, partial [Gordonia sp. (in: high G+C Gram-positive bacteria)]|nr:hypothetical protein [Gordonia sp. (in: high G+C Gram-positive bacteria)]
MTLLRDAFAHPGGVLVYALFTAARTDPKESIMSNTTKLAVTNRSGKGKGAARRARREGNVP